MKRLALTIVVLIMVQLFGEFPTLAGITNFYGGGAASVNDVVQHVYESIIWNDPNQNMTSATLRGLSARGTFDTAMSTLQVVSSFEGRHSVQQTTEDQNESQMVSVVNEAFWFTTDLPLEVSVHGTLNFDLDNATSRSALGLKIWDHDQDNVFADFSTLASGPSHGTISLDESVILPGGIRYFLLASTGLFQDVELAPDGFVSTAAGAMNFTIRVVPEPCTFLFLIFGPAILVGRRMVRKSY